MVDTKNTQQVRDAQQGAGQVAAGIVVVRPVGSRRVFHATCIRHGGSRGFTNVVMTKVGGTITLDPHATGACVIELDETEATAVWGQLTEWLGMSVLPKGAVPLPAGRGGSR
ncbi:MAG: hypothetical protein ACRDRX_13295 [Pseudonocardiaceae bacterium]